MTVVVRVVALRGRPVGACVVGIVIQYRNRTICPVATIGPDPIQRESFLGGQLRNTGNENDTKNNCEREDSRRAILVCLFQPASSRDCHCKPHGGPSIVSVLLSTKCTP